MKTYIGSIVLLAASCFSSLANAQQLADPYIDSKAAIENRQMLHKLMGTYFNDMAAILKGKKEFNGYKLMTRSETIHQLSQGYFEFFTVPDSFEGSNANPIIADNINDFKDKIRALETAAFGLKTAIGNRDPKAGKVAFGNVAQACQQCHQLYRTQQ